MKLLGHEMVHMNPGTYLWIHLKHFEIDPTHTDHDLLADLVATNAFADSYDTPFDPEHRPTEPAPHGPWLRRIIQPERYTPTTAPAAEATLWTWADNPNLSPSPYRHGDDVIADIALRVLPLFHRGNLYQLTNPGLEEARSHSVTGDGGFHEFVAIDREARRLHLIVASDD